MPKSHSVCLRRTIFIYSMREVTSDFITSSGRIWCNKDPRVELILPFGHRTPKKCSSWATLTAGTNEATAYTRKLNPVFGRDFSPASASEHYTSTISFHE